MTATKTEQIQPPLKWAGGKRWLVPKLAEIWHPYRHRRLVEPCAGGLAVALGLQPRRAILNDINPHLVNFYRCLQQGLTLDLHCENSENCYYSHRQRFNDLIKSGKANGEEAAQLFYYLNRTGFNGLCRFNASGGYNVPFGKYKSITYKRDFEKYQNAFAQWQFKVGDFSDLQIEPDDFIYADPPYDVEFTTYSQGGFGWADQVMVAEWLAAHRGPVVLSNQATERIIALYTRLGFEITLLDAPRAISANGDRTPAKEVLAMRGLS